jgi:hypothetical protein
MALNATVNKFGMEFTGAYHKISRLTYESFDQEEISYPSPAEMAEAGAALAPTSEWVTKKSCNFEVTTYISADAREAHAEPLYRTPFSFVPDMSVGGADIIAQAYDHVKGLPGYEAAVDC